MVLLFADSSDEVGRQKDFSCRYSEHEKLHSLTKGFLNPQQSPFLAVHHGPANGSDTGTGTPAAVNETNTTNPAASCTNTLACNPVNPILALAPNRAATVLTKLHGMNVVILKNRISRPPD